MSEEPTGVSPVRDEDIDYSDIPATDADFWVDATLHMPPAKEQISIRLDREVLEWFRSTGPGYQSRINGVLRQFVEHRKKTGNDG